MEFFDEDTRPRFLFQSRPQPNSATHEKPPQKFSKTLLFVSFSISSFLLSLSFYFQAEPFKSLLFWVSLSLLVGPFAPPTLTGGDVRVGHGSIIPDPIDEEPQPELESKKKSSQKRSKPDKVDELGADSLAVYGNEFSNSEVKSKNSNLGKNKEDLGNDFNWEEKEWTEADMEILKKQLLKNPVGKPGRWEAITGAFKGKHRVESVIRKAKELGEKKADDGDSFAQFLKNRKSLDVRVHGEDEGNSTMENRESSIGNNNTGATGWSSGEDIALLNALKVFPKDAAMRWEKIAAAVPGKSKAACMKRVTELKREFRSSKASTEGN